jgi:hypothetical protein
MNLNTGNWQKVITVQSWKQNIGILNQGYLVVKLKLSLQTFHDRHHDLVNRHGIFVSLMTRVTQQAPLEEQTLITLSDHQSAFPVFRGVRVAQSLVLCVVFCRSLYPFLSITITHSHAHIYTR